MMIQLITSAITPEQQKLLVSFVTGIVESAITMAVRVNPATFLDKDGSQLVMVRREELKVAIEQATINALKQLTHYPLLVETRLLKPQATFLVRTKPINLAEFYQTGPGLYVYDNFANDFDLSAIQTVDSAPERPYVDSLLKANAYDKNICEELPKTHLSPLEDIAVLIEAQPGGKSGFLLNNGYANIFYVKGKNSEVFAVNVYWRSDKREWRVRSWKLGGDGYWHTAYHVFCPGNAAL